eukprot:COSAG02_NODE_21534_length_784_cov_1.195620_1_plen_253_part_01
MIARQPRARSTGLSLVLFRLIQSIVIDSREPAGATAAGACANTCAAAAADAQGSPSEPTVDLKALLIKMEMKQTGAILSQCESSKKQKGVSADQRTDDRDQAIVDAILALARDDGFRKQVVATEEDEEYEYIRIKNVPKLCKAVVLYVRERGFPLFYGHLDLNECGSQRAFQDKLTRTVTDAAAARGRPWQSVCHHPRKLPDDYRYFRSRTALITLQREVKELQGKVEKMEERLPESPLTSVGKLPRLTESSW